VVVVGAGPAGLAAGWAIRRAGVDPLIVERADAVAASWRARNAHRVFSHQPGVRMPCGYGPFPGPASAYFICPSSRTANAHRLRNPARLHAAAPTRRPPSNLRG